MVINYKITSAGGPEVAVSNSSGWVFAQSNTSTSADEVTLAASSVSIVNSAGWVIDVANTGGAMTLEASSVSIVNSAGWVVDIANTSGIIVAQSNTGGVVSVANTGGSVITNYDTAGVFDGSTELRMKYKVISVTAQSNNLIVNAVTDKRIRVMSAIVVASSNMDVTFQSDSSSATDLTGNMPLAANVGFVLPWNPNGWFETSTSQPLNLLLTKAQSAEGCITYLETS